MSVHGKIINHCILLYSFFCFQFGLLIVDQVVFNSTLVLFAFDPEGIYDHLTSLSQAKLSSEVSKIVDDLIKNHPRLAEVVGSKFDFGFIELFNSLALKICWGWTLVSYLILSNVLFCFLLLFDKYGEDWAKRSLFNRVASQCSYPVIIHNVIVIPIWTWRVYFGPLSTAMADLTVLTANACIIWVLLCLTEALVIRAVMVTSYKHISGINDMFISHFIFMVNLGFSFGSHFGLFILGL